MLTTSRPCRKCGEIKELTEQNWQAIPNSTDGFRKTCRACKSESDRLRYLLQRDEKIKYVQQWYAENRERKLAYDAQRRINHYDKIRQERLGIQPIDNRRLPLKRIRNNFYWRSLPDERRFVVTLKDIKHLIIRQEYKCFYCKQHFTFENDLEIDHLIPVFRGGTCSIGNAVISCRQCNRAKSHRLPIEFRLNKIVPRSRVK